MGDLGTFHSEYVSPTCLRWHLQDSQICTCYGLRKGTSALVGDLDPYPWAFQFQNAILGSMWVSATRWFCKSKTCRFLSTCGSTGTWEYLQVLSILNRNKVVNCQHKYMWNKILLRHCVTLWRNQIWLNQLRASYRQSTLFFLLPLPHQKHCKL